MSDGTIATRPAPGNIAEVREQIDLSSWANALVNGTSYEEPDPGYISRTLIMGVLMSQTADAVMSAGDIGKLQQVIPDLPGSGTGNIEITDLYVTSSDFGEGMPCYVIVSYVHLEDGTSGKFTTGASYLQAQLLALLNLGTWPIRCQVKRINRKDKGGHYLFQLYPAD